MLAHIRILSRAQGRVLCGGKNRVQSQKTEVASLPGQWCAGGGVVSAGSVGGGSEITAAESSGEDAARQGHSSQGRKGLLA